MRRWACVWRSLKTSTLTRQTSSLKITIVAQHGGRQSQAYARVAGRRLDGTSPFLIRPCAARDHALPDAVLDRADIEELTLGEQLALNPMPFPILLMRTSGVLPTWSRIVSQIFGSVFQCFFFSVAVPRRYPAARAAAAAAPTASTVLLSIGEQLGAQKDIKE